MIVRSGGDLKPATGPDSTKYLRGDGTWATPSGGPGGEAFPVGSVFISVVATDPAILLGYGIWVAFGAGRVMVGLNALDTDLDTAEEVGGAKTHTLTVNEIPAHAHTQRRHATATGTLNGWTTATDTSSSNPQDAGTLTTANAGGGAAHNNMPPYIVVRFWKRIT